MLPLGMLRFLASYWYSVTTTFQRVILLLALAHLIALVFLLQYLNINGDSKPMRRILLSITPRLGSDNART